MKLKKETHYKKIVVFDVDETLGYFQDIGHLWMALRHVLGLYKREQFYELIDLLQENVLRPYLLPVLSFLIHKRDIGECYKIVIYTNNQSRKSWVGMICGYLDSIFDVKVFDDIIGAYKIENDTIQIEPLRTTHEKTMDDLSRCLGIPIQEMDICFIDDLYHEKMNHDNVFYIQLKPFKSNLDFLNTIILYYNTFDEYFYQSMVLMDATTKQCKTQNQNQTKTNIQSRVKFNKQELLDAFPVKIMNKNTYSCMTEDQFVNNMFNYLKMYLPSIKQNQLYSQQLQQNIYYMEDKTNNIDEYEIDTIIGKRLYQCIYSFFNETERKPLHKLLKDTYHITIMDK
jgi:hypothetical protein